MPRPHLHLSPTGWLTLEKLAQQAIWLALFVVLAPVLGPKPYGLFSLVMVSVLFCELVIVEAAAEALLTLEEVTPAHVGAVNAATLATGVVAGLLTCAAAAPAAAAYHAPELPPLFYALSVLPVISAFVAAPTAALKRRMAFAPFAVRSIVGLGAGGIAGVAAAFAGLGVWALVIQVLVQRVLETLTLAAAAPGSLRLGWSRRAFGDLWRCAANVFAARALMWFTTQAPRVIIGATLGPVVLGLYTLAARIVDVLVQVVLTPAAQVARVELRRFVEGVEGLGDAFAVLLREMSLFAFPVGVGLAAVAPTLFALWLGPRWQGAIEATRWLALTLAPSVFFYCGSVTLLALRRSLLDTWVQGALGVTAVIACGLAAPWGLGAVCAALLARQTLLVVLPLAMLARAAGTPRWRLLAAPAGPAAAAALMGLAVTAAAAPVQAAAGRWAALPLLIALGACVYLPLAWLLVPVEARRALDAVTRTWAGLRRRRIPASAA